MPNLLNEETLSLYVITIQQGKEFRNLTRMSQHDALSMVITASTEGATTVRIVRFQEDAVDEMDIRFKDGQLSLVPIPKPEPDFVIEHPAPKNPRRK